MRIYAYILHMFNLILLENPMALEKEFLAMRQIDRAFNSLEQNDRERVIKWANDKYSTPAPVAPESTMNHVANR